MPVFTETVVQWVDRTTEDGQLHVKTVTRYFKDGVRFGPDDIHRVVLAPGMDASKYSDRVQRAAAAEWTPDVIQAAQAPQSETIP